MSVDVNLELVQRMGSKKGYDPMPPDSYTYFLTSEDGVQAALAWVRKNTIGLGHRSPYAVVRNGTRPLTKADLARDCFNGDRANACRAWDVLEAAGLVRCDEKGQLWLCGEVKARKKERRRKGEPLLSVQTALSPYLVEQIEALPEERQQAVKADIAQVSAFRQQLEKDALALARIRADHIEDTMWAFHGLQKIRGKKKRPEIHKDGSQWLQMELRLVPDAIKKFVQTATEQTAPPVRANSKNGVAQTAHKIQSSEFFSAGESSSIAGSQPSVGRSSLVGAAETTKTPTDRPKNGTSENPFKPRIRQWLEKRVKIPGFPFEEPELDQIAATIQTEEHFKQFQEAAKRQNNPRGWIVFVTIAEKCAKLHEQYATAAAAAAGGDDEFRKRMIEKYGGDDNA